jgi:hypothetical protein
MKTLDRYDPRVPVRMRGMNLAGLGDVLDDYTKAVSDSGDAYSWLLANKDAVYATNTPSLISSYQNLILTGEALRQRGAQIHTDPSFTGWLQNLFGTPTNVPIIGTVERALSNDIAVWTADAQKFVSDVTQLKLSVDQYNRLVSSGVAPSDAVSTIEQANQSVLSQIGGAIKWPAISIGAIVLIGALLVFAPEIKAGFRAMKSKVRQ